MSNTLQLLQWSPDEAERIANELTRMAIKARELGPQARVALWCIEQDGLVFVRLAVVTSETTVEVNRG